MDPVQNNFLTVAGQQIFAWSSLDRSNKLSINTQLRQILPHMLREFCFNLANHKAAEHGRLICIFQICDCKQLKYFMI